jgi:hypothetical protein
MFGDLPRYAAWEHRDARAGFEVVFFHFDAGGLHVEGDTAAVEDGLAWSVQYAIALNPDWSTQTAKVSGNSASSRTEVTLETNGAGDWFVDGVAAVQLAGCLDVDLESSSLTNAFPVRRLGLEIGQCADAPAAYVRAPDMRVERLEQRYIRLDAHGSGERYRYTAPGLGFECELTYDESGLVTSYPGIAARVA